MQSIDVSILCIYQWINLNINQWIVWRRTWRGNTICSYLSVRGGAWSTINDQSRSITINHDQLMDNDQSSVNDQWSTINQSAEAAASRKGRKDRCQTTKNASIPASLSTGSSPLESHTRGTQPSSSTEHLQQEPLSPSHHTISCDGWWWYGMVWYGICPPSRRTTTTTTTILMIYMTIPQVN